MGQAFGKKHPIIPDDDGVSSVASSKDSFASRASVLSRSSIGSILRKKKKIVEDKSYRDPPLPNFGKPVEYSLMTDRYYKAVIATRNLNGNIQRDCADSICEAARIPVTDDTDRVRISSDVQDRIALRRSKRDMRYMVTTNLMSMQTVLLYRKHTINLM